MTEASLEQLRTSLIATLNEGNTARLQELGDALAARAGEDLTTFHAALNAVGFHNRLAVLNDMMAEAWEQVQDEPTYSQSAVQSYASRATDHVIYAYLEQESDPFPPGQTLVERLERYFAIDTERLESYMQLLSGRMGRKWSAADFEELKMRSLSGLMVEFLGFASQTGVSYGRGHLVRETMPRYLMDRQAGNLKPKPDVAEALRQGRRPFPPSFHEPQHPLVPDEETLELFLRRVLGTVHPEPYAAAALLMHVPLWNRFLNVRGLVAQETKRLDREALARMREQLAPFWDEHPDRSLASFSKP